jgi:hypothetical protein
MFTKISQNCIWKIYSQPIITAYFLHHHQKFNPCREGLKYYKSKASFEEAWNDCERGEWMLWMAAKLKVDDRTLTWAKALFANTVRHLMKDFRSIATVDATLRYADGGISREELKVYGKHPENYTPSDFRHNPGSN